MTQDQKEITEKRADIAAVKCITEISLEWFYPGDVEVVAGAKAAKRIIPIIADAIRAALEERDEAWSGFFLMCGRWPPPQPGDERFASTLEQAREIFAIQIYEAVQAEVGAILSIIAGGDRPWQELADIIRARTTTQKPKNGTTQYPKNHTAEKAKYITGDEALMQQVGGMEEINNLLRTELKNALRENEKLRAALQPLGDEDCGSYCGAVSGDGHECAPAVARQTLADTKEAK